jgi:hypothetical protein
MDISCRGLSNTLGALAAMQIVGILTAFAAMVVFWLGLTRQDNAYRWPTCGTAIAAGTLFLLVVVIEGAVYSRDLCHNGDGPLSAQGWSLTTGFGLYLTATILELGAGGLLAWKNPQFSPKEK